MVPILCRRPQAALGEPLSAFPSWFLQIECAGCGKGGDDERWQ
jgi:hypothetical protein